MKSAVERLKEIEAMLRQKWPDAFSRHQPLAKGCHSELLIALPEVPKQDLLRVLNAWTHHPSYLKEVMTKPFRIGLDGRTRDEISEEDRSYARMQYHRYLQRQRLRKTTNQNNPRGYTILHQERDNP
ncbi:MAG: ProQ/FINO family protein [Gammaproteobacteria bacterium]